jgi:predicted RNA-binding Zn ribbon-like protein
MMLTDPFLFVGDAVPIDFVNTKVDAPRLRAEFLAGPSDLQRWMSLAGLASSARVSRRSLEDAKALREELRRIFERLADGKRLRADLQRINAVLSRCEGRLRLKMRKGSPHLEMDFGVRPSPAFLIARAAAEFLATADLTRVRRCEGSGCVLLFYDKTKSHTRRWCTMAACGNRAKAAEHYRRTLARA